MRSNRYVHLLLPLAVSTFAVLFALAPSCFAGNSVYTVELKNGQVLTANACKVEGGQLHLSYPVGEASFPLSLVDSVKFDDSEVLSILQIEGEYVPPAAEHEISAMPDTANDTTALSAQPGVSGAVSPEKTPQPDDLRESIEEFRASMKKTRDSMRPASGGVESVYSGTAFSGQTDPEVDGFVDDVFSGALDDDMIEGKMDALFNDNNEAEYSR